MSKLKNLASQTVVYGLGHVLSRALYFIFLVPYLTKRLEDTYSFGVYNDLYGYSTILIVFLSFRMDTALFRFGSKAGSLQRAFSTALFPLILAGLCFVGLLITNNTSIASLLKYPDKGFYVSWFALIIGLDVLMLLPFARLRLEQKAKTFTFFKLFNVLFTILLVLLFLDIKPGFLSFIPELDDVEYVFLANLIASATLCFLMLPIFAKARFKDVDLNQLKTMLVYTAPLVIVGAANSINQFFGVPIQKYFLGKSFVENVSSGGVYAAPQKIAALVSLVTVAFNYAAEPFFFRHAAHSDDRSVYGNIALGFALFMGFVVLGVLGFFEILKHITDVEKYQGGFKVVPILLMAYFMLGLYYNISIWYKLSDKTRYGAYIAIVGAGITLSVSIILLPQIGIIASAWAALVCYSTMVILAYYYGQKQYPIHYPVKALFGILSLVAVLLVCINHINGLDLSVLLKLCINAGILGIYLLWVLWKYGTFLKQQFKG